jgi:hypothetical protein
MRKITLDEIEFETVLNALRLFRHTTSDLADLPREEGKEMASMIAAELTTSLKPEQIDDLIDRLKRVPEV